MKEVGRIKRGEDPASKHDPTRRDKRCRIGIAALLDVGLHIEMPAFPR